MSRAFTKEPDPDEPVVLADRPVSDQPNYMTRNGLAELQQQLEACRRALSKLESSEDVAANNRRAELQRDSRYFTRRIESADVIEPVSTERIRFGHLVEFVDSSGCSARFRIVGEDEADIKAGKLSWTSPLARQLIGKQCGDLAAWKKADGVEEIEIISIEI